MLWDVAKGGGPSSDKNTITFLAERSPVGAAMAWSPDSKFLAISIVNNTLEVWNVANKQNTATFTGHTDNLINIEWSPDGKRIASASSDMTARVRDIASGQNIATFQHPDFVNDVSWAPDSKLVATASSDHNVRIWKVK